MQNQNKSQFNLNNNPINMKYNNNQNQAYVYPPVTQQQQRYPHYQNQLNSYPNTNMNQYSNQPYNQYNTNQFLQGQYPPTNQQQNQYPQSVNQQGYPSNQGINNYSQYPYPPMNPTIPPPPMPPTSPLLRHSLSQLSQFIKKNINQLPDDFQKKFKNNQQFKSLNNTIVYVPSFFMMLHLLMNRNKKWFRLTVNASLIRFSLIGLFLLHVSTNILYTGAYRDLILRNRQGLQKIVIREQLLSGSGSNNMNKVL